MLQHIMIGHSSRCKLCHLNCQPLSQLFVAGWPRLCKVAVAKSKQTLEAYLAVDKATMCKCSPVSTFGPWGHVYLWK